MDAQNRGIVFVILLISFSNVVDTTRYSTIFVSKIGSLISSCGSKATPCRTIDLGLQRALSQGNNTRISLKQGSYTLEKSYNITAISHFAMEGEGHVEIICSTGIGIAFIFATDIRLYNLKLRKCGGWQKSLISYEKSTGEIQHMEYLTAIYFSYCKHLQMQNVVVSESHGVAVTLTDVTGSVDIADSLFKANVPESNDTHQSKVDEAHAGGGIFVMLNSYGYNPINISREDHDKFQHHGKFILRNVRFLGNEARSPDIDDKINSPLTPFSRGGGLGIYLFGNASSNTFTMSRCTFIGNRAQWGGGLQTEFKHETGNNSIEVVESIFSENYASFAGGAARIGDITISKSAIAPNRFSFKDCKFMNNTSIWGGGVSIYGTTFIEDTQSLSGAREKFVLTNSVFSYNKGNVGSALGLFLFNLNNDNIGPLVAVHVVLANCTITNNHVVTINEDVLIGQGAVYSVEVPITSRGYLRISNNTHTSMVLDSAILVIHGHVNFSYNTGYRGGALAMYGNSRVRFAQNTSLFFIGNQCSEKGGAVFVDAPGSPQVSFNATGYATHQCFFEYIEKFVDFDLWETEIIFQGNVGPSEESGLSIYATSLQNCRRVDETRRNNSVLKWKIIKYLDRDGLNHSNINKQVSTDPVDVVFRQKDWFVAPSEIFNASITLLDEIGNPVYGMVSIDIQPKEQTSRVRLATSSNLFLIHERQVALLTITGHDGDQFDVILRSVGRYVLQESINNLTLKGCNPGFKSDGNGKCICNKLGGVSRCADDGRNVFLKKGFWAGPIKPTSFLTAPCPVNYCKCPNPFNQNAIGECTYVKSKMCAGNRDDNSVLCGECKPGYTASFGSESCIENCSKSHIAYLFLIGLSLIVLVMCLMVINVDAFTGYLNAWLYSYQVILLIVPGTFEFDDFMEFIIGLANLRLRVGDTGTCIFEGLDEVDKFAIMYMLPGFLLFLVFVIAKLVKYFPNWRYSRCVRAPYSAVSTIFVLCYTNITGISLKILNPVLIDGNAKVFVQGGLDVFQGKHIAYGILACLCILFVVLLIPFVLICQPCVAKCLRQCFNVNMLSLKPLFDKLQGCFKDEYRWCAAFYFISRLIILCLETFVPHSSMKRALLETACVAVLVMFVWLRPYKEGSSADHTTTDYSWINNSDALLLTNLTLIAVFSSAIDEMRPNFRQGLKGFINFLAYVPLMFLVYVLCRSYKQYSKSYRDGQTKCDLTFQKRPRRAEVTETEASTSDNIRGSPYAISRHSAADF